VVIGTDLLGVEYQLQRLETSAPCVTRYRLIGCGISVTEIETSAPCVNRYRLIGCGISVTEISNQCSLYKQVKTYWV
jgi:hypothetical protein